jgi:RNA polymerase sigma-70 factor (ECF subfamily)
MSAQSLDDLLGELNSGNAGAAERAFISYEPYLRKVVRRLLPSEMRAKFDSIDVVQSVYGDVLSAFRGGRVQFRSAAELRAFLIRATRNRFIDRLRQHRTAARLERPLEGANASGNGHAREPRPSETAAARELWERLLVLCPPEHHRLLELRRAGATAAEIATETGLHEGSVRRLLRELSKRLALEASGARAACP